MPFAMLSKQFEAEHLYFLFVAVLTYVSRIACLDNGLAKTPPMGWLAWERFQCNIRCDKDPSNCISEKLFMDMADRLVSDGYKDAGYEYINIDDCWMSPNKDANGSIVADPVRFSSGIKFLADYMHARGLKLGIYQDYGEYTCMGYPGLLGHEQQVLEKFAEWDVDMLKLDACFSNFKELDWGYIKIGKLLRSFGKPILYSCSWPFYQLLNGLEPNYKLISQHCNMWRNYQDIHDNWRSIEATIDFFGDNQEVFSQYIGPGRWSDPDMLMIGNHHLTLGQSRAQMAVWSMIPAPLLMSNDLRDIKPESKAILLNKKVIAVNQDLLGIPGKRVYKEDNLQIWKRQILPSFNGEYSYALLFLNTQKSKIAVIKFSLGDFDLKNENGYVLTELFQSKNYGIIQVNEFLKITVEPMDVIMLHCQLLI